MKNTITFIAQEHELLNSKYCIYTPERQKKLQLGSMMKLYESITNPEIKCSEKIVYTQGQQIVDLTRYR